MLAAIYSRLIADAALLPLVSDRIYPDVKTGSVSGDYLVYSEVGRDRPVELDLEPGQKSIRVQFDAYCADTVRRELIADTLSDLFSGASFSGSGVVVDRSFFRLEISGFEPETKLYRKTIEFIFYYH